MITKVKQTVIIIVVILVIVLVIYFMGRRGGKKKQPDEIKVPRGVNIPSGWDPNSDARVLHNAMKGGGTDEERIFSVLENKNDAQLALIYNAFSSLYKESLLQWFEEDLSGSDLSRALSYFKNLQR